MDDRTVIQYRYVQYVLQPVCTRGTPIQCSQSNSNSSKLYITILEFSKIYLSSRVTVAYISLLSVICTGNTPAALLLRNGGKWKASKLTGAQCR